MSTKLEIESSTLKTLVEKARGHLDYMIDESLEIVCSTIMKADGAKLKHSFSIEIENNGGRFKIAGSTPDLKQIILTKNSTDSETFDPDQENLKLDDY